MLMHWTLPMERMLDEWLGTDGEGRAEVALPAADVTDDGEVFRIVMEMPGVTKDGLEIEVKDGVLHVRGQRPRRAEKERVLVDGRRADRKFERHVTLGQDIDQAAVQARLENGLLIVTLPRRAEVKPQRIEVQIG